MKIKVIYEAIYKKYNLPYRKTFEITIKNDETFEELWYKMLTNALIFGMEHNMALEKVEAIYGEEYNV